MFSSNLNVTEQKKQVLEAVILDKIFGTKQRNLVKLDRTKKV